VISDPNLSIVSGTIQDIDELNEGISSAYFDVSYEAPEA